MTERHMGGEEVYLHLFSSSAIDINEWSISCPSCLLPPPTAQKAGWPPKPDYTF
jgi:hypothetical protein